MTIIKCDCCGKEFNKSPSHIAKKNFCCKKCYSNFMKIKKIECKCQFCGEIFYRYPSQIKYKKIYCSQKCKKEDRREIEYTIKENGCWECNNFRKHPFGYSIITINNKNVPIYRYMYEKYNGEIPKGLEIRHKCDNPACINPEHLETGTHQDNMNDMKIRKRARNGFISGNRKPKFGEETSNHKLTEKQVLEIKKLSLSQRKIAEMYNVSRGCIKRIKEGTAWGWLIP